MASAEIIYSEITAEDVKKIFNEYNPQLVQYLPLKDCHFIAFLTQQHLFSGTLKEDVMELTTPAEAATLFLMRAVERPLSIADREPFDKLLLVMEKFGDSTLNKLAKEIKHKLSNIDQRHSPVKRTVTEVAADQNQMITPEHTPMSLQSPDDESPYMNVNVMKFKSASADVPPPLPPRTRIAKDTKKLPVQEPTNQFKGTKLSKPMKADESPIQKLTNQFEGAKMSNPVKESPSFAEALQSHHYHIKWTLCSDLPCKLYHASVAVSSAADNVYVTAGFAPDNNTYNNVYCYNTNTDHWTVLPQPGHRFGILHMLDDKLTIFGGTDAVTRKHHNKVTTYNNDTSSWYSEYPDMLNKRVKPGVITYNNHVIVMGGNSNPDNIHDNIEVMNYHNELKWKNVSVKLPVPMWRIKPTISGDNITIVGFTTATGRNNGYYQIAIEEILDQPLSTSATSNQWKMMSSAPYYYTAIVPYSNPSVIIGGGDIKSVPTCDITLYDSSKNSWRKVDSLTSARNNVGVALLNNNTIIVIGGTSGGVDVEGALASSLTTVEIGNIVVNQ